MNNNKFIIILDNIRSALNVGAIFRTADAVGVEEIILLGISPDPSHKKVKKTALGAEETVHWQKFKEEDQLLDYLANKDIYLVSVEQTDISNYYHSVSNTILDSKKIAFAFGNEITGVSTKLLEKSNNIINLPMLGKKESLNVATSAGIILYHFRTYERHKS